MRIRLRLRIRNTGNLGEKIYYIVYDIRTGIVRGALSGGEALRERSHKRYFMENKKAAES